MKCPLIRKYGTIITKPINDAFRAIYIPKIDRFCLQKGLAGTITYHYFSRKEWKRFAEFYPSKKKP